MKHTQSFLEALKVDATPSIEAFVQTLRHAFPLLSEMGETPQDPEWHAEGNVCIHTGMVLDSLYQLLKTEAQHIVGEHRQALILGALFHDIAKPLCTRASDVRGIRRIIAPRHEALGRSYLASRIVGLGLSDWVVGTVMNLVGEHHMPVRLIKAPSNIRDFVRLSRQADCELLYWLEKADMLGRVCIDQAEQVEYVELFKELCESHGVWSGGVWKPYLEWEERIHSELQQYPLNTRLMVLAKARDDFEAGRISTLEEAIAKSYGYRDEHAELVILCGPSGSGKSTWTQQQANDYEVISLDALRQEITDDRQDQSANRKVVHVGKTRLKQHLGKRRKVIWDATSIRFEHRQHLIELGKAYQAFVTLVVFQKPYQWLLDNNRKRDFAVPDAVLEAQIKKWEWPARNEAHQYLLVS